jgi:hypothetical protein
MNSKAILFGTVAITFTVPVGMGLGTGYYGGSVYGSGIIVSQVYVPAPPIKAIGGFAPERPALFKQEEDQTQRRHRQQRQIESVLLAFLHTQD